MKRVTKALIVSGELLIAVSLVLMATGLAMNDPRSILGSLISYTTARRIHTLAAYAFIPLLYLHTTAGLSLLLRRTAVSKSKRGRRTIIGLWTALVMGMVLLAMIPQETQIPVGSTAAASVGSASGLTLAEVAEHNSGKDCWVVIGNDVYNVTALIDQHPGGREAILKYCGTNATDVFFSKHDQAAYDTLQSYYVGTIGNATRGSFESSTPRTKEGGDNDD